MLADIGERIRAERHARGWSEAWLGRKAGMGRNTVRRLENGDASLRSFVLACTALGVPMDRLLASSWKPPDQRHAEGPTRQVRVSLSPREARVLREAASGDSLSRVGARLGMDSRAVGWTLSRVYQRLGVAHLARGERRAAAVRVAMHHGLFNPPENRTS
jgi:DNA-binding CsgD family transcriptional regulator